MLTVFLSLVLADSPPRVFTVTPGFVVQRGQLSAAPVAPATKLPMIVPKAPEAEPEPVPEPVPVPEPKQKPAPAPATKQKPVAPPSPKAAEPEPVPRDDFEKAILDAWRGEIANDKSQSLNDLKGLYEKAILMANERSNDTWGALVASVEKERTRLGLNTKLLMVQGVIKKEVDNKLPRSEDLLITVAGRNLAAKMFSRVRAALEIIPCAAPGGERQDSGDENSDSAGRLISRRAEFSGALCLDGRQGRRAG